MDHQQQKQQSSSSTAANGQSSPPAPSAPRLVSLRFGSMSPVLRSVAAADGQSSSPAPSPAPSTPRFVPLRFGSMSPFASHYVALGKMLRHSCPISPLVLSPDDSSDPILPFPDPPVPSTSGTPGLDEVDRKIRKILRQAELDNAGMVHEAVVAPALTRKQRRKLKQRANRALGRLEKAIKEGRAAPREPPAPAAASTVAAAPAPLNPSAAVYSPKTTSATGQDEGPPAPPKIAAAAPKTVAAPDMSRGPPREGRLAPRQYYPPVYPFNIVVSAAPGARTQSLATTFWVPTPRYVPIKYYGPPGAPWLVPAVYGPDPSGQTAWFDDTGRAVPYPRVSLGGGESANAGFGAYGHYWPDLPAWAYVYSNLGRGHLPSWRCHMDDQKSVGRID